jgi:hypothetical protein
MGVNAAIPTVPNEGQATWSDDTATWGATTNVTWSGWSPQGGTLAASTPATATVNAADVAR